MAPSRLSSSQEGAMIRDVMFWLDGGISDEIRLAAVADITRRLQSNVIIGLFLNPLPLPGPVDGDATAELIDHARQAGDETEALLARRLQQLERPVEIRRFDVLADDIANVAAREARSADTFVALRPNGAMDPERVVEAILFGSGRHLFLFPEAERPKIAFDRIVLAWNGSRESARAMAEGMPFLLGANEVTVTAIADNRVGEDVALVGVDAVRHLQHHGIEAGLHHVKNRKNDPGAP